MTRSQSPARAVSEEEYNRFDDYFQRYADIIPDYDGFLDALSRRHVRAIRINTLKTKVDPLVRKMTGDGVTLVPFPTDPCLFLIPDLDQPGNTLEYILGHIHVQAISSALAASTLAPRPGQTALDLCAAPGGKTTYMAQLMENRGLIVANDFSRGRISALTANISRLGATNVVITMYPGQDFPLRSRFDRVLLDVPCSGEGRHRMEQRARLNFSQGGEERLTDLQKRLILRGFDLLDPDGVMVYSTCAYNPAENEGTLTWLLENRPARLLPIQSPPGAEPGIPFWKGKRYDPQVERCVRFYPHRIDTVGFFMAKVAYA